MNFLRIVTLIVCCFVGDALQARVRFVSPSSQMTLAATNAQVTMPANSPVYNEQSIVKVRNIGTVTGLTTYATASWDLLYSTSDWVANVGPSLLQTSVYLDNRITTTVNKVYQDFYGAGVLPPWVTATSNAVNTNGPVIARADVIGDISCTNISLTYDLFLSQNRRLLVDTTAANVSLNGQTHSFHCAREITDPTGVNSVILISGGKLATFTNVVLKDFAPQYVQLSGGSQVLFGDGTTLEMTSNNVIDTSYTMSCSGKVFINCFGNELNLAAASRALDVLPSSTLCICNARISGLGGLTSAAINNLKCLGPDSTLTLSNCELVLSSNYSFTEGYMTIYRDVLVSGTNVFAYKSPRPLTIRSGGQLKFDMNTTFSYDSGSTPQNASATKLVMENALSKIYLNGATLHVTTTGLVLTKGTVVVDHLTTVRGETSSASGAIVFGDGIAADNLSIEVMPGASMDCSAGYIMYNNID